ncbi:hypothetical protein SAMN06297387_108167 [Streptomyces zhaozhouensis]|uniref:Lipoprotein n=1 Tax=Streptomyces zhaozhouensis TaxID=1300267 RepID=A0A286DWR7_9ACTN|nr:hypothetical protein [Streptomyces zhaozhouensis]SOD63004.1 hypothetical protein SAMN06297387_108167 [Streptomyces zhaozhouensis]
MSTVRTALAAAGLGVTLTLTAAPAAHAVDDAAPAQGVDFGYSVSPGTVRPGGAVDLTVTGCTDFEATAESPVFDRVVLGMPGELQSARTTVDTDARRGAQYDVVFSCGNRTATARLTIAAATATPAPSATPTATSTTKPSLGAQAGVGGTQSGLAPMLLAGAGLTVASVAGGAMLVRRRASRH